MGEHMIRRWAWILSYLIFTFALLGIYFPVANKGCAALHPWQPECPDYMGPLFSEDGFGEWLQFHVLLLLAGVAVWQGLRLPHRLGRVLWYVFAFAAALVALEEISWGQRLFDWRWEALQALNRQNETNLHNLLPLYDNERPYWVCAAGGIALGLFAALRGRLLGRDARARGLVLAFCSAIMLFLYLTLENAAHAYFFEYSELWIYATGLWLAAGVRPDLGFGAEGSRLP